MLANDSRTTSGHPHRPAADKTVSARPLPTRIPCADGDLAIWMMRRFGDMQLHVTVHVNGRLDAERLARAVRLSLDAQPILACRFREHWWHSSWERHGDLERLPLCRLEPTTDLDSSLQAFYVEPFDPASDPLVHARIFRQEHDTLCVKMSHVVADGGSLKQYMYLLCSIYNQLGENPDLVIPPRQGLDDRRIWQIMGHLGWRGALRVLASGFADLRARLLPLGFWNVPVDPGPSQKRRVILHRIEPEQVRAMKAFCHHHNVSRNDLMVAAYLRALRRVFDIPATVPLRLTNTVDLRRYLPCQTGLPLCNLSSFSYLTLPSVAGEDFVQTALRVSGRMRELKSGMLGTGELAGIGLVFSLLPAALSKVFGQFAFERLACVSSPVLTNSGRLDATKLVFRDCPVEAAYLSTPVIFPPQFGGGFSTFRDLVTMSFGFCETGISPTLVEQLLTQTQRELPV